MPETPKDAVTDGEIADCHAVMAELRPQVGREEFLPLVRSMQADGRDLCFDDPVTAESKRSKAHGRALLAWLCALAVERAHAFYLREGLELSSHHFSVRLDRR